MFFRVSMCACLFVALYVCAFSNISALVDRWNEKLVFDELNVPSLLDRIVLSIDRKAACGGDFLSKEYYVDLLTDDNTYWRSKYFALLRNVNRYFPDDGENNDGYAVPKDFNLIISVRDIVPTQQDVESYAEVFINRRAMGRTSQGLRSQKKLIKILVSKDVRHMLQIRKYILNSKLGEWVIVRNIEQPKIKYFYVPKNRIRVIEIIYNSYYENPQYEQLKYQYKTFFLKEHQAF